MTHDMKHPRMGRVVNHRVPEGLYATLRARDDDPFRMKRKPDDLDAQCIRQRIGDSSRGRSAHRFPPRPFFLFYYVRHTATKMTLPSVSRTTHLY